MRDELNPQAREMADESMVRNLAAQAEAIWPQERLLFDRYRLPANSMVLDAGCGTGEMSFRLAQLMPGADVLGIDIIEDHLGRARARCTSFGSRVRFENRSIFDLALPALSYDLLVCRHVLQSIPHAERALAELVRVGKRGGWLHLIAEDYGMIHFEPRALDPDEFWAMGPKQFGEALGTDMRIGRRAYGILRRIGLLDITVDYVIVDPLRVPRETFAAIWTAWRDGYADIVSAHSRITRDEFLRHFEDMLASIRDPFGYGVWLVPVVAGRIP